MPKDPHGLALEYRDEEIDRVGNPDQHEQHDQEVGLPLLPRVVKQPDKVDADDELDKPRDGDVGCHAEILVEQRHVVQTVGHVRGLLAEPPLDAEAAEEGEDKVGDLLAIMPG